MLYRQLLCAHEPHRRLPYEDSGGILEYDGRSGSATTWRRIGAMLDVQWGMHEACTAGIRDRQPKNGECVGQWLVRD